MSFEVGPMALMGMITLMVVTGALLYGWQGWLALKLRQAELAAAPQPSHPVPVPAFRRDEGDALAAGRIELADLKERVRQLEAIASGVDL